MGRVNHDKVVVSASVLRMQTFVLKLIMVAKAYMDSGSEALASTLLPVL